MAEIMLVPFFLSVSFASPLDQMLERGIVSNVELKEDGRLRQVTAMAVVHATPEHIWTVLTEFEKYSEWMPRVGHSIVTTNDGNKRTVDLGINVPGPNVRFDVEYVLDEAAKKLSATATSGTVKGGQWDWRIEPQGSYCLVYRTTYESAVIDNWLVRQFDDDTHTIEVGLNAATPLIELQGLKRRAEK